MIADARAPRWCRSHDGTPKLMFGTEAAARRHARKFLGTYFFRQYLCPGCCGWHNATRRAA